MADAYSDILKRLAGEPDRWRIVAEWNGFTYRSRVIATDLDRG